MKRALVVMTLAACSFPRPADVKDQLSVGGVVHGLWTGADGVTLRLTADGVDVTHAVSENGTFSFPASVTEDASYIVVVVTSPVMHTCAITGGATGIVPAGGIASIDVACRGPAVFIELSAPEPWTFDPTRDVQSTLEASVMLQDVTLTVDSADGVVMAAQVAGQPVVLGKPSTPQRLSLGVTPIDVDVLARNGFTMRYRIAIERGKGIVEQAVYGKASNTGRSDSFGRSVAVFADTLAVGAPGEDSSATGVNGNQSDDAARDAGAVYIFRRDGSVWAQQAYVKASSAQINDGFGASVALSGDTLVVGAPGRSSGQGVVYVFRRIDGAWAQQAVLGASNAEAEDLFGIQVALSGDTLAVSAPSEDSSATGVNGDQFNNNADRAGAVYIFQRTGTFWTQQAYIKASNTARGDAFGTSLTLSGDTVAVGAPHEASTGKGINGTQIDNSAIFSGAAYVFQRTGTIWAQQVYIKASNAAPLSQFGTSVALSGDTLAVGAVTEASSATGIDGNQMDTSAYGAGAVYIFQRSGNSWAQQAYIKASNTETFDAFGFSIALSGDVLAIGAVSEDSSASAVDGDQRDNRAPESGAVYVFKRAGGGWAQEAYLKASNVEMADSFGSALALSNDTLVVAAVQEDGGETGLDRNQVDNRAEDAGAIYVFR